jgi:ComF family protein
LRLWRGLVELVFPAACAGCGRAVANEAALCPRCDAHLPRLAPGGCRLCQSRPAPAPVCPSCLLRASGLEACLAAAPFGGEVARWIHRFKYPPVGLGGLDPGPAAVVCALVREAASQAPGPAGLVVPVPLHAARLRARGFNPAAVLARSLARAWQLPLDPCALRRVRDTPSQTGLDRRQRARNVADAFRIRRRGGLPGRVWLVDDVVTTGSTLEEAARALRSGGVQRVVGLCAARTPSV